MKSGRQRHRVGSDQGDRDELRVELDSIRRSSANEVSKACRSSHVLGLQPGHFGDPVT